MMSSEWILLDLETLLPYVIQTQKSEKITQEGLGFLFQMKS